MVLPSYQRNCSETNGSCSQEIYASWDFPGSPVVKTSPSNAEGAGSIPGQRAKIPHALWPKKQKT